MSVPPMSGPVATAMPLAAPQTPKATPRRSAGTAADSRVSVSGVTIAAPTPCAARAAISSPIPGASAAAAEAAVKIASPMTNSLRRPKRSPRDAPNMSRTAKVRV